jgi:hypothetical protein
MGIIYFNAHKIKKLPYIEKFTLSDTIRSLGFDTIMYHPDANDWMGAWSMDEKEYLMLVLKYG